MELPKTKNQVLKVEDGVAYLELTQGQVAMIDVEDLELVGQYKWRVEANKAGVLFARTGSPGQPKYYLQKLLATSLGFVGAVHLSDNKLDNRKANIEFFETQRSKPSNRVIQIKDGVATVELGRGLTFTVDSTDLGIIQKYRWAAASKDNGIYVGANISNSKRKRLYLHRLLTEAPEDLQVDHVDCNPLNNCRSNLRVCSRRENQRNRRCGHGTSKFKGVYWNKRRRHWVAEIRLSANMKKYLGGFASEAEAAVAYDKAALMFYGEFARTNIILNLQQEAQ